MLYDTQVGIILDNSGYELFGDMCLAEVILRTTRVSSVTFHMKSIPWFRSDVTEGDMEYMLDSLRGFFNLFYFISHLFYFGVSQQPHCYTSVTSQLQEAEGFN